jgi:O-antigen biosynthesis protein
MFCRHPIRGTKQWGHVLFFNGFEGVKTFCREIEREPLSSRRTVRADNVSAANRLPEPGVCPPPQAAGRPAAKPAACNLDEFDLTRSGYVIFAPDYVSYSAGPYCLYRLCNDLNQRGFPSCIVGSNRTLRTLAAPLVDWNTGAELCKHGYTAVYPEVIAGNRLNARFVARWVLNRPGLLGGEKVYDDDELVFNYSDVYKRYIRNKIAGKLYLPTIDEGIFFSDGRDHSERSLECFYIGKSQWKDGFVDRSRAFEITRTAPPKKELGKLLRASRVLYTFDNSTIFTYEAILCGCPVVVIPDGTQTKEDYMRSELGMDGIAWGVEELEGARADVAKLQTRYNQAKRAYFRQLDRFVTLTQQRVESATRILPFAGARREAGKDSQRGSRRAVA